MSDPRLLSAEDWSQLRTRVWLSPVPADLVNRLAGHIAALTEQLATLRTDAAKLGHEPVCAYLRCGFCKAVVTSRYESVACDGCLYTESYHRFKPQTCNCAQSRIQGVKHERE